MRFRRPLALLAGLASVAALVLGGWSAAQFRSATLGRPWFVAPSALTVGPDGTAYVGIGRSEIQVYEADGRPRRAWYLEDPEPFGLRFSLRGLEVVFASDRVVAYDAQGVASDARREPGAYERLGEVTRESANAAGTRLALRPEGLVRLAPLPERVLVPAPPRPLSWFGARPLVPITGLLIAALIGLVACLALARRPDLRGVAAACAIASLCFGCAADGPTRAELEAEETIGHARPMPAEPDPMPAPDPAPIPHLVPPTSPVTPRAPAVPTPPVTPTAPANPTAPEAKPPAPAPVAPAPEPAAPPTGISLEELGKRIKRTQAIGVFTKLALKNDLDDLLAAMRSYHDRGEGSLPSLQERFEALVLKLLTLLEKGEPDLAIALARSREDIWGRLVDPVRFAELAT